MGCESCQKKQQAALKQVAKEELIIQQQNIKQTFEKDINKLIEQIKKSRNVKTPNKEEINNA